MTMVRSPVFSCLRLLAGLLAMAPVAGAQQSADAPGGLPRHASFGLALAQDSSIKGPGGVVVQGVTPGRTGAVMGVQVDDRILSLNDSSVGDVTAFIRRGT